MRIAALVALGFILGSGTQVAIGADHQVARGILISIASLVVLVYMFLKEEN